MQVIAFIKRPQDSCLAANGLAWYITTKEAKILFLTGNAEGFLDHIKMLGIPTDEIDIVLLAQECWNAVRELECFLKYNRKAKVYLPRLDYQTHLQALYYKLRNYANIDFLTQLKRRIVFMDEVDNVGNGIQVFTETSKGPEQIRLQSRNLILSEGKMQILFSGNKINASDCIQEKAEFISGKKMDYFFYWKESHECIEKNCMTCEKNELPFGQAISIDT